MVPSDYHAFFAACASVAGALIGLVFVAISVTPHKLAGERASARFQVRAGLAFATLVNALVISLFALLPGTNLGNTGIVVSVLGISSLGGLTVMTWKDRAQHRPSPILLRMGLLTAVFVLQLVNSIRLILHPHESSIVGWDAYLVIAFFLVAIDRAWELVGATNTSLVSVLGSAVQERRKTAPADAGPDPQVSPDPGPDPG